ncbi:MAG: GreA/GreB family elongation factor [Chloroflexota bacterium]
MALEPSLIARHSTVLVELVDSSGAAEQVTFTLVESKQADFKSGLLDENAPLGRVLIGHRAGEVLPYAIGDLKEVRILSVERSETVPLDAAEKRRKTVRNAEAQAEIINQLNFATASGSKWGDYDVDVKKLMEQRQKDEDNPAPDA